MKTKKFLGIDVSAHFIVYALLDHDVDDLNSYLKCNGDSIKKVYPNQYGIREVLELGATHAILEPTGVNYSKIWAQTLAANGIEILWVGHCELASFRRDNRLTGKNDYADALALATYGLRRCDKPKYFIKFDPFSISGELRQLSLQLTHLNRCQSPIVNRIRQGLAYELPEIAEHSAQKSEDLAAPLWRWIAGRKVSTQSSNKFGKLLDKSIGNGISEFTRHHAKRLCDIHDQEIEIERSLFGIVNDPMFDKYNQVFDKFKFGRRVRAMLLSTIYPFETYLNGDRKEIIEVVKNRKNNGTSKRYRSLSSFKLSVGFGLVEKSSGKEIKWVVGGSNLCRIAMWQWEFTCIEIKRLRPDTEQGKWLGDYRDKLKDNGINMRLVRSKVCVKAVEMLFYELLKVI